MRSRARWRRCSRRRATARDPNGAVDVLAGAAILGLEDEETQTRPAQQLEEHEFDEEDDDEEEGADAALDEDDDDEEEFDQRPGRGGG